MKITTPGLKKLDDRSRRTIFVGYEPGSKAYRLFDPTTRRVHISRDVMFDEGGQWSWAIRAATSSSRRGCRSPLVSSQ